MIHKMITNEHKRVTAELQHLQAHIKTLPPGHFLCSRNGSRYKWYHSDGKKQTYIPKKNRFYAEQLAQKNYMTLQSNYLLQEKHALELYLKNHLPTNPAEELLANHPEYQKLLSSSFCPISEELNTWMHEPYDRHTGYPEQLSIQTCSGKLVRSKSEALIDMILSSHKIPFRYECALSLGSNTLYPDFTIRHPQNGQTFYWEHFGLMDDPCYSNNAFAKLQLYASHGIIPSINMITTYETKEHPLSPSAITKIVEEYFL